MSDSNFKQAYMDHWLKILYGPFPKYFERTKISIIKQAALAEEIPYTETIIAYFKGVAYSESLAPIGSNPIRIDLLDKYKDAMEALFQEKIDIANEQTIVKGYLSRILNLSVCQRDVDFLLHDSIRDHLLTWRGPINDQQALRVLEGKRTEFQKRNKQFSDMVSERILTNLLLQHGG